MRNTAKFYAQFALFSLKEEFSSFSALLGGILLYPCFIWIFSKLWLGLNNNISTLSSDSLYLYIGLTEILFMTGLREPIIDKGSTDFSLSFIRPRSWPVYTSVSIYSKTLCRRLLYLIIFLFITPFFTGNLFFSILVAMRFLLFLPLITMLDILYSFLLTAIQIRFFTIKNFRMLIGKLFLIFGGVLAPLSDLSPFWQNIFIKTPFSDLIFQPCYFSIKGNFYNTTPLEWLFRILIQLGCLIGLSYWIYVCSRRHYHNYGG